ncbi:MAG: efflux RND transporter permease subunit [bacterium]|nr:efflux RND transporter permease subunit [bacterium]
MIARVIAASVRNRLLVVLLTLLLVGLGLHATRTIRLDAIPDLSDVQVIVVTDVPGQNPQVVDDQVTYPLANLMLAVPGSTAVRGFSMFELSFVYVLFEDGTDLYWARSRVLEALSAARERLPPEVQPRLGPDATGVGWVYQYVLYPGWYCASAPRGVWRDDAADRWWARPDDAPPDRRPALRRVRGFADPGTCPLDGSPLRASDQDLSSLRALQDWYVRQPLNAVPGVAEVASIGGFVREYQVVLRPERLLALDLPIGDVVRAVERSNRDVGGAVVEMAEHEYMVRSRGYLGGVDDLAQVPVRVGADGTPVLLGDVATIQVGGAARRGVGELDGRGEAVGGVVVARFGENAYQVIQAAKAKLAELEAGLPPGVYVLPTYDRSALIERAVGTLRRAVIEELIVTALVCLVFLAHVRSALVAIVVLPIGLLVSLLVMQLLGINANVMSLGGLALAVGVMVDSAVVMIENAHKHLERERARVGAGGTPRGQAAVVLAAAVEVGPSLFFSLLVITVSFLPIFVLGEQSGRLFGPLAYTKTFAIAAGAVLGITVVPALMVWLVRGRIPSEAANPLNRAGTRLYEPAFHLTMRHPVATLAVVAVLGASALWPLSQLGEEFMPPLDEGDLLYMPTTDPGIGVTASTALLQQTDRLIKTFPEVVRVHGKIGRAETATDPAPLSMIETVVQLEPDPARWRTRTVARFHDGWPDWLAAPLRWIWSSRRTITREELTYGWTEPDGTRHPGLHQSVSFPGVANAWPYPIENRLQMLTTGIKTPVGVKVLGPDLDVLSALAERTANVLRTVPGTVSAYPERTTGGYYLDVDVDRGAAARYGLTTGDVQDVVQTAVGGMAVTTAVEGLARYPVTVRYARELRDDLPALRAVLVPTATGTQVPLGQLATLRVTPGPPMIRSEDARRSSWVYVDITGRDLGGYVREARARVDAEAPLPPGYTRLWSGRFEQLERANARLRVVVPITLVLIVLLLYAANGSWLRVGIVLLAVPFSLIGAFWFLWILDYDLSLAVWVGIIALLGIDAETGQVMLLYLDTTLERWRDAGRLRTADDLYAAIHEGAVQRLRPKTMTVATDLIGLLPLLWVTGTGADVTRRLVAPLVGGITVSFVMELLVYPVVFYLAQRRRLRLG